MNDEDLQFFKRWFSDFCESFSTHLAEDQRNITLKREHTAHVCSNIVHIARELSLAESGAMLAEVVALFHDVGRFPQYRRFRTFVDGVSVNHAALGVKVLLESNVLERLPRRDRDIVVRAVALHNVLTVPDGLDGDTLLAVKMIRDADKLDIWRVFSDYYTEREENRASAAGLGLPDVPDYSANVLSSLLKKEVARMADLKTLNDFKLLQLSWMYDVNFTCSLKLAAERNYIDAIAAALPQADEIKRAVDTVRGYADRRIRCG